MMTDMPEMHPDATAEEHEIARITIERNRAHAILAEMIDRLTRDAESFRQLRHVSVSDARIRADACKVHSEALAKLLTMARDLADAGHHDRAIALLRGDMPAPKETP